MWDKIKKAAVEWAQWAEANMKGKSGAEKRAAVLVKLCGMVDVPLIPEFIEGPIKRWVFGYFVDLAVEKWNWLTDWAFGDLKPTEKQIETLAECVEAPLPKLAAAAAGGTLDERLAELCRQYKVVPPAESGKSVESVAVVPPKDYFADSIRFTLKWEGGYVDHPADKGGPTNMGITQPTLNYAKSCGLVSHTNVRNLTRSEAEVIYRKNFWERYGWGELAWPVCLCALDCSVNHGGFAYILQRACNDLGSNLAVDGKFGPKTRAALTEWSGKEPIPLAQAICDQRKAYFDKIIANDPGQEVFRKGWYNRLRDMAVVAGVKSPV